MVLGCVFFCTQVTPALYASEPLRGPESGLRWWLQKSSKALPKDSPVADFTNDSQPQIMKRDRFLDADIPIPMPLWVGMPFATLRIKDRIESTSSRYLSDHKIGIGLLHHAAEGDPSWRIELTRQGPINKRPSVLTRAITSLIKPFPWLRIRASDNIQSWVGVNYVSRQMAKELFIPEFAWIREGQDGFLIDLIAPKHLFLGLRSSRFGMAVGLEQDWEHWSANHQSTEKETWDLRRRTKLKLAVYPSHQVELNTSISRDIAGQQDQQELGVEVALKWSPTQ